MAEFTPEQIKNKIKKLLKQSESPFPEEAQSALLMAQKLLLKYKIDEQEIKEEDAEELEIIKAICVEKANTAWAMQLARIVATNFGTMLYYSGTKTNKVPVFFGEEDKAMIGREIYDYVVVWLNKRACNYATKMRNEHSIVKGVKQDFILGFLKGLEEKFAEQTKGQESKYALVLVVQPKVKEAFKQMSFSGKAKPPGMNTHGLQEARQAGYREGKAFDTGTNGMKTSRKGELR